MVARTHIQYKRTEGAAARSAAHTGADSAWATMWRQAFHAALCWLTLSGIPASGKTVNNAIVKDNVSAESASRLYRNVPLGVYASAAPYAAYSFHLPAFIAAPKPAASRIIPVKEHLAQQNVNSYLRDSYGNKFVATPQSAPYKNAFAQQFLQLQELPAHLTQPLVASPQAKQATPHYFVGSPYRLPAFQSSSNSFGGFSQPFVFAQNFGGTASSQATPANFQGTSSNFQANPTNFQGTSSNFQANPTNFLTAPANYQGTSSNFQGTPIYQTTSTFHGTPANLQTTPTNFPSTQTNSQSAQANAQSAPTHTQAITVQQRPTSNKAAYSDSQSEYYKSPQNEVKFQRLENKPQANHNQPVSYSHESAESAENSQEEKVEVDANTGKTTLTAVVNGKKQFITLDTKPPVPLIDLSLLEPLTFDNPLVPQIQHYLPKISGAKYHKLPNPDVNEQKHHKKEVGTHKSKTPKRKQKQSPVHSDNHHKQHPIKPSITVKGVPNKTPEFSYEINAPNFKETYKEQSISYNKETESDPVTYNYDKESQSVPVTYTYHNSEQKKPVHYNYVHTSKEPVHIKKVNYQGQGQGPKQLIYTFSPQEQKKEHRHIESGHRGHAADTGSSEESYDAPAPTHPRKYHSNKPHLIQEQQPRYYIRPVVQNVYTIRKVTHRSNGEMQLVPNEEINYEKEQESPHDSSQQTEVPARHIQAEYHSPQEYEENIRISSTPATDNEYVKQIESYSNPHPSPLSSLEQYQKFVEQQTQKESTSDQPHSSGAPIVHEKAKRIIIQEETPEEMHSHDEQIKAEMIDHEDNNEEEFEKAYKNAAFGFPAFDKQPEDTEKDIYSPEGYGYSHDNFDVEKTPFQEYQAEGDRFPKSSRAEYKDAREGTKEDYYLDYSIHKPESLADRYQNQADYYKLYKSHKPDKFFGAEEKKKKSAYTVAPSFGFGAAPRKQKQGGFFEQYKSDPVQYEYNFDKEAPRSRDSSAHASRPYHRLKSKTNFVEPQFQYGFEPIGLPRLLDSELAAMASNNSPESEKPGTRKKLYHENWYIKKTSTTGGEPS